MRRSRKMPLRTLASLAALLATAGAQAQPIAPAADGALGLYGYERHSEAGAVPAEYGLVIVHYPAFAQDPSEVLGDIRRLAADGRRVLVDFQFMTTRDQRRAVAQLPPIDRTAEALRAMLRQLEGVPLEGVTLDEENRTRPERMAYLAELYLRAKAEFPERRLLQWLSLGAKQTRTRWDIERFPADGFVIDPYLLDTDGYHGLVEWLSGRDKPIYSVVWASPGWRVGAGVRKAAKPKWWNRSQWRTFYNRLAVNQRFGAETILFSYALDGGRPAALSQGNDCDRAFARALLEITGPRLRGAPIDLEIPASRPDWIPGYCQSA